MGKLILVSGENSSGKSVFAEKLISNYSGKHYYIATMIPKTEDNYQKIEIHKKQRNGFGFVTYELPYSINEAIIEPESAILLEDVSNLLANNIFDKNKNTDEVFNDILKLLKKCRILVAVTISGLENQGYDADTAMYINSINEINQRLYDEASVALRMTNGKPLYEKGNEHDIY